MEKVQQLEDMSYSKLTNPDAVLCWFQDSLTDLCNYGESEIERSYLAAIDDVARRTGANNFWLADYIWRLEARLEKIEKALRQ